MSENLIVGGKDLITMTLDKTVKNKIKDGVTDLEIIINHVKEAHGFNLTEAGIERVKLLINPLLCPNCGSKEIKFFVEEGKQHCSYCNYDFPRLEERIMEVEKETYVKGYYILENNLYNVMVKAQSLDNAEDIAIYNWGIRAGYSARKATIADKKYIESMNGYILNKNGEFDNLAILL